MRLLSMPALLERYRSEIISCLPEVLRGDSLLFRMMRHQLGLENGEQIAPGKTLRPTLCLLACEAIGGDWRKALPAAIALELVHNFSLIHDDIQDQDKERRHRPTVWALWGVGQAINAGDALHALSSLMLCELEGFEKERVLQALRLLAQATFEMIEGQCLDLEYESRFDLTVQDYLEMISKKTGALMSCALELGALLGGADTKTQNAFKRAGRHLGLAFQIRDDLLGIWGSPAQTGKPTSDLKRKKKTLPVVYALGRPESRARILEYLKCDRLTDQDIEAIKALLEEIGADRYAQEYALSFAGCTRGAFEEITLPHWAAKQADELVSFSVHRWI